jgi:hypothetical protein
MAEAIIAAVVAGIPSLIGVWVGFRLSEHSTRDREERAENKQTASGRLLLSIEIDYNLRQLRSLWTDISEIETPENLRKISDSGRRVHEERKFRAKRFVGVTMPVWNRRVWEAQTPLLASALSTGEIEKISQLYGQLDTLVSVRASLAEMAAEQPRQEVWSFPGRDPTYHTVYPHRLDDNAPALWAKGEQIVNGLLSNGNPLSK